jgi:hypothetical protein
VLDTLDANLNWATLKPGYKSHNCEITISNNGVAKFNFRNIYLPYKNLNEALSNGMFTYTIHTKPNLPSGTTFQNSASIYFDYNEPIITNRTINTLDTALRSSINPIEAKENYLISIAPNPMIDVATIYIGSLKGTIDLDLIILDVLGKKVKTLSHQTNIITINRNDLSSGIYFYELKNNGRKIGAGKFVME